MTLLLDFETRSRADLPAIGGRLYAEHPSTEALCCVMHDTDTGATGVWLPGDAPPFPPGTSLAAHNAMGFDRFIAERLGWPTPDAGEWIDTSELARRGGLPGALDALGTRWLGRAKDKAGSAFTKALSRPSRAKARLGQLPALTDDVMARVVAYCASDVEIMAHGWSALRQFNEDGVFASWERDVSRVDRIVNDRGVAFDSDLARRLLAADARNQAREFEEAARVFGAPWTAADVQAAASSPEQFTSITGAEDATAETVKATLRDTSRPAYVLALCRARQALASIAAGKLRAGLAGVSRDGRLRDLLRYYGAHTGRWSGRRLQPHNFTRPTDMYASWGDDEICAHADLAGGDLIDITGDLLDVLLRATITASAGNTLAVCDFSGVEARWLAWTAGDQAAVDVFLAYDAGTGPDPYKVAAARGIYGIDVSAVTKTQRSAGKVAELACGYQGGAGALERMAANMGIDLAAAGVSPADVVNGWRALHAPIVRYWRRLNDAFVAAVQGKSTRVWPYEFVPSTCGRHIAVFLPSGRPVIYNDVGLHRGQWPDGRPRLEPYYIGVRGHREHLYGGKIAENLTQAGCRDLMAEAMVEAESRGLPVVLTVHDEIVVEVPRNAGAEGLAELKRLMTTPPEWAEGFPVGAAGHHGTRYRK